MKLNSWIYENISDEKTIQDLEKIAQDIQDEQYYLAGKNDGIMQVVSTMLQSHVPIRDIVKYTGLFVEEIEKLRDGK
ncbi:unknown [Mycoplasma sp. CAG:776]|nr:unknown [Mycoplasma sp. CAG:776]